MAGRMNRPKRLLHWENYDQNQPFDSDKWGEPPHHPLHTTRTHTTLMSPTNQMTTQSQLSLTIAISRTTSSSCRSGGVVRVDNANGVPKQTGDERDNSLRNMLSRHAYYSARSNAVFTGQSAREALEFESRELQAYSPHPHNGFNQTYVRAPRGLPLNALQAKKLRTLYRDKKRFSEQERTEAYLLLRELYLIAKRVLPFHRVQSMSFLLEPNGFDATPSTVFSADTMSRVQFPVVAHRHGRATPLH